MVLNFWRVSVKQPSLHSFMPLEVTQRKISVNTW